MVLLGSTLGNHFDPARVLANLRDSMTSSDYLLVGVELTNLSKVKRILKSYETVAAQELVTYVLEELDVPRTQYQYGVIWNGKDMLV